MKLLELILQSGRLSELEAFYGGLLGMQAHAVQEDRLEINMRDSRLVFTKGQQAVYHFAFNISSNKLMRAFEWLKARVELIWIKEQRGYIADFTNWNARSVYFLDPAGNIVEIIARFDLPDKTAGPFSPADIYSISEAGLVFPKATYEESVLQVMRDTGVGYFAKQPPLPGFAAVGDDEGLLICVPEGRNWYSLDNVRSAIWPIHLKIGNNMRSFELGFPGPDG